MLFPHLYKSTALIVGLVSYTMSQPQYANYSNSIAIERDTNPYDTVTAGRAPKVYYTQEEYGKSFLSSNILDTLPLYIYNIVFDTFVFQDVRHIKDMKSTPHPFIIAHRELLYSITNKSITPTNNDEKCIINSIVKPLLLVNLSLGKGQLHISKDRPYYISCIIPDGVSRALYEVHHKVFEKDTFWVDGCQWTLDQIKLYNIPLTREKYTYTFDAVFINTDCLPEYKNKYGKCVCGIK